MTDATTTETQTPPADPAATPDASATGATDTLPDWAKDPTAAAKMVADLRAENARDRTAAKEAAAKEARDSLLKQLGLKPDDKPVTPEDHERALSEKDARIRDLTIKSALSDALSTTGAKPLARAAILGEGILADLDPTSPSFAADVASKVQAYVAANPELKAQGQAPSSSGPDAPGGNKPQTTYTRAQLRDPAFYQANKADIEAALYEGRIRE